MFLKEQQKAKKTKQALQKLKKWQKEISRIRTTTREQRTGT